MEQRGEAAKGCCMLVPIASWPIGHFHVLCIHYTACSSLLHMSPYPGGGASPCFFFCSSLTGPGGVFSACGRFCSNLTAGGARLGASTAAAVAACLACSCRRSCRSRLSPCSSVRTACWHATAVSNNNSRLRLNHSSHACCNSLLCQIVSARSTFHQYRGSEEYTYKHIIQQEH